MVAQLNRDADGWPVLVEPDEPGWLPSRIDVHAPRRLSAQDPIVRALGWQRGIRRVVDATAGLGTDSLALAAFGFEVTAIERHPLLQALWQQTLAEHPVARLRFVADDARGWLTAAAAGPLAERPEAVLLDPMYPHHGRKTLAMKELRLLRALVGDDDDARALGEAACAAATARVVVKRPRAAAPLLGRPDHVWEGRSTRYDLHLVAHASNGT